jgi:hypothetical protein
LAASGQIPLAGTLRIFGALQIRLPKGGKCLSLRIVKVVKGGEVSGSDGRGSGRVDDGMVIVGWREVDGSGIWRVGEE